jgi:hypothetical protein
LAGLTPKLSCNRSTGQAAHLFARTSVPPGAQTQFFRRARARELQRSLGVRRLVARRRTPRGSQLRRHCVANPAERRQYAEKGQRAAVDHLLPVDQNGQLAVMALDEYGVDAQLSSQKGRRTGGLNPRHSVAAPADRDAHWDLQKSPSVGRSYRHNRVLTPNAEAQLNMRLACWDARALRQALDRNPSADVARVSCSETLDHTPRRSQHERVIDRAPIEQFGVKVHPDPVHPRFVILAGGRLQRGERF